MIRTAIAVMLIAACGDNDACPSKAVCEDSCAVSFTGNFDESQLSTATCPVVTVDGASGDALLGFAIISTKLRAELDISIDLGSTPGPGVYSPETVGAWSAAVAANAADSDCEYSAGSMAVPTGTFTLTLDTIAPPHGVIDILQFVQAAAGTPCGIGETETVEVDF